VVSLQSANRQSNFPVTPKGATANQLSTINHRPNLQIPVDAKKALRIPSGALLCRAEDALLNYNKLRIARADHPLCKYKAVHVNRDPAVVYEHEVRVPDQPDMVRSESLDEELFRMPPKTKHFAVTRPELLFVHRRRLIRARHVSLARARHVRLGRASARA
jgi:hypothetical protein